MSKLSRFVILMPWLRLSIFILAVFAVSIPFTQLPERFTNLAARWGLADRSDQTPARPSEALPSQNPTASPAAASTSSSDTDERSTETSSNARLVVPAVPSPIVPQPTPVTPARPDPPALTLLRQIDLEPTSDVREMARGLELETAINYREGDSATELRNDFSNYRAKLELSVAVPEPTDSSTRLSKINPQLPAIFEDFDLLIENAEVSPFYADLIARKQERLSKELTTLSRLTTRHNFFDCETILAGQHPTSKRKFLWIQGDMDVVSDGSDGDRLPTMPDEIVNSTHYQPFTSYGWRKSSNTPNPMIAGWEQRIRNAKAELAEPNTKPERKKWLNERIEYLQRGIEDMKYRSFLIAEYDPFIVVPIQMITYRGTNLHPKVGDFAAVVFEDKLFPAIVGDAGPSFKVGEASLRIAREIDPQANPYRRPVSDLKVSYLVFPDSASSPKAAPDLDAWHRRCQQLIDELGGLKPSASLHKWSNLFDIEDEKAPEETTPSDATEPEIIDP